MKFTIEGFNQEEVLKIGSLDVVDLVILRWIVDFEPNMVKKEIDGEIYFWVNYQSLLEALPILKINKQNLYRKLKKMCDVKILKHKNVRENGNYSYYSFGPKYSNMVMSKMTEPYVKNDLTLMSKMTEQNNSSIKEIHLLNNSITSSKVSNDDKTPFQKFWEAYPRKVSKGNAEKWFDKNNPSEDLVNRMIAKLETLKKTKQWKKKDGQFIPYPATWLNAKGWEDEILDSDIELTEEEEIALLQAEVDRRKANGEW